MRRLFAAAALAGAVALLGAHRVAADASAPPVVTQWSPQTVQANGQPVRITLVGSNLSGVTEVFTTPVILQRSVAVVSDQAAIVTLPANLDAGTYGIQLVSSAGSTAPGSITVTVTAAPPPQSSGGAGQQPAAAGPPVSLAPAPVAVDAPARAAAAVSATGPGAAQNGTVTAAGGSGGTSPLFVFAVGIALGGLLYALWGKEGRLRVARRRGFLAQVWGRPLQRLRLARICLQCGKLHYVFNTRRDLWKAGDFCSATCFVADQEKEAELASSEGVAPTRLRGVGVYTDLELTLQSALRGEASAHAAALFKDGASHNPALVPVPAEPETRVTVLPERHESAADAIVPITIVKLSA